jgi:hypothetical protein
MEQNLLVAAKTEYTEQLQDILKDSIYEHIKNIWNKCKEENKTEVLQKFQHKLCTVPQMNQATIIEMTDKILEKNKISQDYLDKIIEAIFLSHIKILSVVKLNSKKHTVNVKVPDTKHFIHKCLVETARNFYSDPYLIDDREYGTNTKNEIKRNIKRSHKIISESVDKTIRSMIPMEDILTQYLADQKDSDSDEEKSSESETQETQTEQPVPEPQQEPQQQLFEDPQPEDYSQDLFEKMPEETQQHSDYIPQPPEIPPRPQFIPQEPQKDDKIKIDLKDNDSHFFSDSE